MRGVGRAELSARSLRGAGLILTVDRKPHKDTGEFPIRVTKCRGNCGRDTWQAASRYLVAKKIGVTETGDGMPNVIGLLLS